MLEAPRPPNRVLPYRRPREVDVYGGAAESEPSRPSLFAVIWRRRWIVLLCTLFGLVGGVVYYLRATPIYSSTAVVYVQDNALRMVGENLNGGPTRTQTFLYTQCQLIGSTAILSDALSKPSVAAAKTLRGESNPVGLLKGGLQATPDKFSDLIMVSMESTNAQDAATLTNAVVESYVDYQRKAHRSTAGEVLKVFQTSRDAYEKTLTDTQQKMLDLKRQNPELTFTTDHGSLLVNQLGEFSNRMMQAQLRQLDIRNAVTESELVKDDPTALRRAITQFAVSSEADMPNDPAMQAQFAASRQRLEELRDRLGQKNDLVKSAEKQVGRIQEELQQATRDAAAGYQSLLKQSLRIADARVAEAERLMKDARGSAVELNFKQAEYEQMKKDEDRITRSIDLLDARMKEINVNEDVGSLTVSVLESAKPGFFPVRPLTTKVLGIALVAGLMAGVGLAMLRDLLDQRLRSSDEITALLELSILGTVPHIIAKKDSSNGRLVEQQPRSTVAESYRTIRTAIGFGFGDGSPTKTLLFTSPAPGDGKSTCVSNLAQSFVQSGRRTLLIDADCRRPTQDRTYDLPDGPGLADVLSGQADLAAAIRKTGGGLDILPCGHIPPNPAELLDSQALLDLLGRVAGDYDQVLIDSPPVIAVTDARILAASCDASVLILRADRSTRRLAEHARDALQSVGANLLGVIVNDVPRGKSGYGYDYYGTGNYGYRTTASLPAANAATNGQHDDGVMSVPGPRTIDG